jgi:ClpP class serine protease
MSAHNLFRLAAEVWNKPHLITPESFRVITDFFSRRNDKDFRLDPIYPDNDPTDPQDDNDTTLVVNGTGVLLVDGSLTYKPVMTMCGEVGTSYQSLIEQMNDFAEAGIKTVVMQVSSGGGQGSHCFETANEIRAIADANDMTLIGYADEYACSAAYALICVCDTVIANPSSELGSIGVLIALMDQSKALEMAGLKPIFITAGDDKVPFAEDGSFKESFLEELQADVDRLNAEFVAHVSKYTGLDAKTIRGFQARSYDGATAVSLGLANAVMTNSQFAAFVAQATQGNIQ